jgi:hypothetical protein
MIGVGRLLMSLSDYDIPIKNHLADQYINLKEIVFEIGVRMPKILSDLIATFVFYGIVIGLSSLSIYACIVFCALLIVFNIAFIYMGREKIKSSAMISTESNKDKDDGEDEKKEDRDIENDDLNSTMQLKYKNKPLSSSSSPLRSKISRTPYYFPLNKSSLSAAMRSRSKNSSFSPLTQYKGSAAAADSISIMNQSKYLELPRLSTSKSKVHIDSYYPDFSLQSYNNNDYYDYNDDTTNITNHNILSDDQSNKQLPLSGVRLNKAPPLSSFKPNNSPLEIIDPIHLNSITTGGSQSSTLIYSNHEPISPSKNTFSSPNKNTYVDTSSLSNRASEGPSPYHHHPLDQSSLISDFKFTQNRSFKLIEEEDSFFTINNDDKFPSQETSLDNSIEYNKNEEEEEDNKSYQSNNFINTLAENGRQKEELKEKSDKNKSKESEHHRYRRRHRRSTKQRRDYKEEKEKEKEKEFTTAQNKTDSLKGTVGDTSLLNEDANTYNELVDYKEEDDKSYVQFNSTEEENGDKNKSKERERRRYRRRHRRSKSTRQQRRDNKEEQQEEEEEEEEEQKTTGNNFGMRSSIDSSRNDVNLLSDTNKSDYGDNNNNDLQHPYGPNKVVIESRFNMF